jgi:hypothetical protein
MQHSLDELVAIIRRHYPAGIASDDPHYRQSEEYQRLAAARRAAGAESERWYSLLERLAAEFRDLGMQDKSTHLPTGQHDAGYSGALHLPTAPGEHHHAVGFMVSFLVPYYCLYSVRVVDDPEQAAALRAPLTTVGVCHEDTLFILPAEVVKPEVRAAEAAEMARLADLARKQVISFDLSPDEVPYAVASARAIEETFTGYAALPREVGEIVVPDVATPGAPLGEARLYDCLFSDAW